MRNILLRSLFPLALPIGAFATSSVDVKVTVDPFSIRSKSHVDLSAQKAFSFENFSILAAPQLSYYFNNGVDLGLSVGHRWSFLDGFVGHHVFLDKTFQTDFCASQIGTGFDYIINRADFRINYYHPLVVKNADYMFIFQRRVKACRWFETEASYRFKYFTASLGPTYNLESDTVGLRSKISIPFGSFSINAENLLEQGMPSKTVFSTSFNLYRMGDRTGRKTPISHSKRPVTKQMKLKYIHPVVELAPTSERYQGNTIKAPRVVVQPKRVLSELPKNKQEPIYEGIVESPPVHKTADPSQKEERSESGFLSGLKDFFFGEPDKE